MIVEKIEKLIRKLMSEQARACLAKVEKVYTEADKYCAEVRVVFKGLSSSENSGSNTIEVSLSFEEFIKAGYDGSQ